MNAGVGEPTALSTAPRRNGTGSIARPMRAPSAWTWVQATYEYGEMKSKWKRPGSIGGEHATAIMTHGFFPGSAPPRARLRGRHGAARVPRPGAPARRAPRDRARAHDARRAGGDGPPRAAD